MQQQQQQQAAKPPAGPTRVPKSATREAVGHRVRVWWSADAEWYSGEVASYDTTTGEHLVEYDDGDIQTIDLQFDKVCRHATALFAHSLAHSATCICGQVEYLDTPPQGRNRARGKRSRGGGGSGAGSGAGSGPSDRKRARRPSGRKKQRERQAVLDSDDEVMESSDDAAEDSGNHYTHLHVTHLRLYSLAPLTPLLWSPPLR